MIVPDEVRQAVKVLYDYYFGSVNPIETTVVVSKCNGTIASPSSQFNLPAIKWKEGRGQDRKDARPDALHSYAFVTDTQGQIYPEIKALYDEVCRYGTVHTEGWEISLFGDRTKMLSKRRPKEK